MAAAGHLTALRWPDFSDYSARVVEFYQAGGCAPAWVRGDAPTAPAQQLIDLFHHAERKGLDPADYDGELWAARTAGISGVAGAGAFDLALTVSAMRYVSDLHFGRFNPGIYHRDFDIGAEKAGLPGFIRKLTSAADVKAAIESIEPPFPGYRRTEAALARYLAAMHEERGQPLPEPEKTLQPGDPYAAADRLAEKLRLLGDLASGSPSQAGAIYNKTLADAVKRFQARHGLEADGRLGKATVTQLNTPLAVRVRQLDFTLERWRWVPHTFDRPPIVVNIPEFELRALNASYTTDLPMNVVVGKAYGHKTPVFSADLKYVVFRPYWEVPSSIQRGEVAPKLARDRNYLDRNGYEVVTADGKPLPGGPVSDATLERIRSGALRVRQRPGAKNALGPVKFLFPNQYNVYLHGTPETELFARARRDFSHGCIRVERPEDLAVWVLRDVDGWTRERIHAAMSGKETITVTLDRPVPVLIVYATAVALEDGEVRFLPDIYGQDAQLEALCARGYPCAPWAPR